MYKKQWKIPLVEELKIILISMHYIFRLIMSISLQQICSKPNLILLSGMHRITSFFHLLNLQFNIIEVCIALKKKWFKKRWCYLLKLTKNFSLSRILNLFDDCKQCYCSLAKLVICWLISNTLSSFWTTTPCVPSIGFARS